jgi:hypothetical protein
VVGPATTALIAAGGSENRIVTLSTATAGRPSRAPTGNRVSSAATFIMA